VGCVGCDAMDGTFWFPRREKANAKPIWGGVAWLVITLCTGVFLESLYVGIALLANIRDTTRVDMSSSCEIWNKNTKEKFKSRHTKIISLYCRMLREIKINVL
jgi:hypothetical protein